MKLTELFNDQGFEGITATPVSYTPDWGLYAGELCYGMRFTITDEAVFRPVHAGLGLLQVLKKLYPESLKERLYPTAANPTGAGHLDRLTGIKNAFDKIETRELMEAAANTGYWKESILPFLLY